MRLSDISGVKVLGRAIGVARSVNPSDVDGDGDGFTTGPDGQDNVPFVAKPKEILSAVGRQYAGVFEKQRKAVEDKFGDLRKPENVRKAVEKSFPNLREFSLIKDDSVDLNDFEHGRIVALLHLADEHKDAAKTVHRIGFFEPGDDAELDKANAAAIVSFAKRNGKLEFEHSIVFRSDIVKVPRYVNDKRITNLNAGWGDFIAGQMAKDGVPEADIDRFWGMYLMSHEWGHVRHNTATFKQIGLNFDSSAEDLLRALFDKSGQDSVVLFQALDDAVERSRNNPQGLSAEEVRERLVERALDVNLKYFQQLLGDGNKDDLSDNEMRQLGGNYPKTVSPYAATNFKELVAEKTSAETMGHPAGAGNNPAWRKLNAWLAGGKEAEEALDTTGMTRQERRAAERAAAKKNKKKSLLSDVDVKAVNMKNSDGIKFILSRCEGFTHIRDEKNKKSASDIVSVKIIASSVGESFDIDGEGKFCAETDKG